MQRGDLSSKNTNLERRMQEDEGSIILAKSKRDEYLRKSRPGSSEIEVSERKESLEMLQDITVSQAEKEVRKQLN